MAFWCLEEAYLNLNEDPWESHSNLCQQTPSNIGDYHESEVRSAHISVDKMSVR